MADCTRSTLRWSSAMIAFSVSMLGARAGQRQSFGGDMGGQRLIGGVQLEMLIFQQRLAFLDRALLAAEQVERESSPSGPTRVIGERRNGEIERPEQGAAVFLIAGRRRPARLAAAARLRRRSLLLPPQPCAPWRLPHPRCRTAPSVITSFSGGDWKPAHQSPSICLAQRHALVVGRRRVALGGIAGNPRAARAP